ncbi:MAG: L,D-transpeptidase [Rhodobacter sp.]|nr:L,D-transpeptidase [Rhodobacter sp.]
MPMPAPIRRALAALCLALCAAAAPAEEVAVLIDLSDQEMTVWRFGEVAGTWPVSTARAGKCTPTGTFRPQVLKRTHFSTRYGGAPMPWSIFFSGHYAIHGTNQVDRLGQPASAGCVRLHPDNAEALFGWVREAGKEETVIVIRE